MSNFFFVGVAVDWSTVSRGLAGWGRPREEVASLVRVKANHCMTLNRRQGKSPSPALPPIYTSLGVVQCLD